MLIFSISFCFFTFTFALHAKYITRLIPAGINTYTAIAKNKVIPPVTRGFAKTKAKLNNTYIVGRITPSHLFFRSDKNTCKTVNPPKTNITKNVFSKSLTSLSCFPIFRNQYLGRIKINLFIYRHPFYERYVRLV